MVKRKKNKQGVLKIVPLLLEVTLQGAHGMNQFKLGTKSGGKDLKKTQEYTMRFGLKMAELLLALHYCLSVIKSKSTCKQPRFIEARRNLQPLPCKSLKDLDLTILDGYTNSYTGELNDILGGAVPWR